MLRLVRLLFGALYGLDAREYSIQESGLLGLIGKLYTPAASHCAVQIDTPNGPVTLGFGPESIWEDELGSLFSHVPREIDQNTGYGRTTGTTLTRTVPLSAKAGQDLINALQKMRFTPPTYQALSYNCHYYCNSVLQAATAFGKE
jgi:hypothetical protein